MSTEPQGTNTARVEALLFRREKPVKSQEGAPIPGSTSWPAAFIEPQEMDPNLLLANHSNVSELDIQILPQIRTPPQETDTTAAKTLLSLFKEFKTVIPPPRTPLPNSPPPSPESPARPLPASIDPQGTNTTMAEALPSDAKLARSRKTAQRPTTASSEKPQSSASKSKEKTTIIKVAKVAKPRRKARQPKPSPSKISQSSADESEEKKKKTHPPNTLPVYPHGTPCVNANTHLIMGDYLTRNVPGKVPSPPLRQKRKPSYRWLVYAVLARSPTGAMVLNDLFETIKEWVPNICDGSERSNNTLRHALVFSKEFWLDKDSRMWNGQAGKPWNIVNVDFGTPLSSQATSIDAEVTQEDNRPSVSTAAPRKKRKVDSRTPLPSQAAPNDAEVAPEDHAYDVSKVPPCKKRRFRRAK